MNKTTNINDSLLLDDNLKILDTLSRFIALYFTTIISIIGISINLSILITLRRNVFRHKFYETISITTFFDLAYCVFGAFNLYMFCSNCEDRKFNTYNFLFYKWYIIILPCRAVYICLTLAHINLITNRYFVILNKSNIFTNISKKILISSFLVISWIIWIFPFYFVIELYSIDNTYSWRISEFGSNIFVKIT